MKKTLLVIISVALSSAFTLSNAQITNYTTADGLISDAVNCVEVDSENNIWVGTSNGLSMYDGSTWTSYTEDDGLINNNVRALAADAGDIWVGTDFGASKFDGSTWTDYTTADGLALNQIADIALSPNGDLWFAHASFSAGFSMFDGTAWTSFGTPDLPISGVTATSFDSSGDIWFASPLDGVVHYDGTTFTTYTNASVGLVSNYSTSILCSGDEKWVGTSSGMAVLDPSNTSVTNHTIMYVLPPPDTLNPVVDIALDSYSRVWTTIYVGYLGVGGVACWNGEEWEDFDVSDGMAGPNVRGLDVDLNDNVWVATSTGLSRIGSLGPISVENVESRATAYPNPALNHINTNMAGLKSCYNMMGELLFTSDQQRLEISHLTPGVYFLHSSTGVVKFIKK